MRIPIVLHKDPKSDYGVIVPDLPGCFSAGRTLDEAIAMAREAIECHIEGMIDDHESLPALTPLHVHQKRRGYAGGTWAIVEIDLARLQGKARRINLAVPERVLRRVDRAAERAGESRSGFLTRAALQQAARQESRPAAKTATRVTASTPRDSRRAAKKVERSREVRAGGGGRQPAARGGVSEIQPRTGASGSRSRGHSSARGSRKRT